MSRKVLIVEDELIIQMHLARIVEAAGHEVSGTATSAEEALQSAKATPPDLVMIDIHLRGGVDGIETARELRDKYDCAVVFATAHADAATLERSESVGASGYVVKPFTTAAVRAAITTALASRERIHKAEERERSYASVLSSMGGVLVADVDGVISFLNPPAAKLIGWETQQACDRPLHEVVDFAREADMRTFEQAVRQGLEGRATETFEARLRDRQGEEHPVRIEVEPVGEGEGPSAGVVIGLQGSQRSRPPRLSWGTTYEPFGASTRLLVYSHDTFGLGHLQRSLNLIRPLLARHPGLSVLLVTGSAVAHRFELPPGADYVKLPTVQKVGQEQYESRSLRISDGGILTLRSNLLLRTIRDYQPNALLVDHSPLGMSGELLPSLEWLKQQGGCTTILGLRDIIDGPESVQKRWHKQGVYDVLQDLYDHVVVYGAREVYDAAALYDFPPDVAARTHYVGYVSDEREPEQSWPRGDKPLVAVSIGGGDGGHAEVIGTYLDMLERFRDEVDFDSEILTGPLLPAALQTHYRERARDLPVHVTDFLTSTIPLFSSADLVISTAGYNTSTQLLRYARRALMIPRILHRDEQLIRAQRLGELGLVCCLHPDGLTPESLYQAVRKALANGEPLARGREEGRIPLDGAQGMVEFCSGLRVAVPSVPARG